MRRASLAVRAFVAADSREFWRVDFSEARLGRGYPRQTFELAPGGLVGDVVVQKLGDGFERPLVVLGLLFFQVREALQERTALVGVLARLETGLDRRHELGEARSAQVDRLEHLGGAGALLGIFALPEQGL